MKNNVYNAAINTKTPHEVTKPIRGTNQAPNNGGGYSFVVDAFTRLDRFLILGSDTPTYYSDEKKLTEQNVDNVLAAIKQDGVRVVNRVVEISEEGRAPKNDPALLVLALVMQNGDIAAKTAAIDALPRVARIGTHLFTFAQFIASLGGWKGKNSPAQRAARKWFNEKTPMQLAQQITKYAGRNGWDMGDVLRLAHAKPMTPTHDALFGYTLDKPKEIQDAEVAAYMNAIAEIKRTTTATEAVKLITDYKLPREVIPTELLNSALVWDAMLPHMGIAAMVRNLAKMTSVGLIKPLSDGRKLVVDKLANEEVIKKSRIHPVDMLKAFMTYGRGAGVRGSLVWTPNQKVLSALDDAFYMSFKNVKPTGKRILTAVDVSGSMSWGEGLNGVPGLTPRIAAALFAMIILRSEKDSEVVGFSRDLVNIPLHDKMRLDAVVAAMSRIPMGSTNISAPFVWATQEKLPFDAFYVLTDNEVNSGVHPAQALKKFRADVNPAAKLVVAAFTATEFSIADPNDGGMLDICGFDSAAPALMTDFIR